MFDLEIEIDSWRKFLRGKGNLQDTDIEELEGHLRDEFESMVRSGLTNEEAFLIAVKRLGNVDSIAREFAKTNSRYLWKQLIVEPEEPDVRKRRRQEICIVVILSVLAGSFVKIPELFGVRMFEGDELFYVRNLSLFVFPLIGFFFFWRSLSNIRQAISVGLLMAVSAILVNIIPSYLPNHTALLTGIHLPILLWLGVGVVYTGQKWLTSDGRMDFIRFSGELFIYSVLILCGGMVLVALTQIIFSAIGIDTLFFNRDYLAVFGAAATPIVAAYLVEEKKSIIENLAPVLAKIFAPLFLLILLAFLIAMVILGKSPFIEREFLIGFDLMLVLVLGLVLYILSAREEREAPGIFDYLNFLLIAVALIVDGIALSAIAFRISSFGVSPNKIAALGENIILFIDLCGLAVFYIRFLYRKHSYKDLLRWQTAYLPIIGIWAAFVTFLFPVIFQYR